MPPLTEHSAGATGLTALPSDAEFRLTPTVAAEPVRFCAELKQPLPFREALRVFQAVAVEDERDRQALWAQLFDGVQVPSGPLSDDAADPAQLPLQLLPDSDQPELASHGRPAGRVGVAPSATPNVRGAGTPRRQQGQSTTTALPADRVPGPILTVDNDVVSVEGLSADLGAYACLTLDRHLAFSSQHASVLGTAEVSFGRELGLAVQALRSYRPSQISVSTARGPRANVAASCALAPPEQPGSLSVPWLRAFTRLQGLLSLPLCEVQLSREALYRVLLALGRLPRGRGQRTLRFELAPGQPPRIVVEPGTTTIVAPGAVVMGARRMTVRVWGIHKLVLLFHLLPHLEQVTVFLAGTGSPCFIVADLGPLWLVIALSGWAGAGSAPGELLERFAPPVPATSALIQRLLATVQAHGPASLAELAGQSECDVATVAAALYDLCRSGLLRHDLGRKVYRARSLFATPLAPAVLAISDREVQGCLELLRARRVRVLDRVRTPQLGLLLQGKIDHRTVSVLVDHYGVIKSGTCHCTYHGRHGIHGGACRHLRALAAANLHDSSTHFGANVAWYEGLRERAGY